jgi:hypothetical protein
MVYPRNTSKWHVKYHKINYKQTNKSISYILLSLSVWKSAVDDTFNRGMLSYQYNKIIFIDRR